MILVGSWAPTGHIRQAAHKVFLHNDFRSLGRSNPNPRTSGHSLSKTTEKGHLHKVFVQDIPTSGSLISGNILPKNFIFRLLFPSWPISLRLWEVPPSTVKHFRNKIRNKSGNAPETLSEQILNFQVSYGWRSPNRGKYNRFPPQISFRIVLPPAPLVPFPFGGTPPWNSQSASWNS